MIRQCDGTDPNLTRSLADADFAAAPPGSTWRLSPWDQSARDGEVVVCCDCGLVFDDVSRRVNWPHEAIT